MWQCHCRKPADCHRPTVVEWELQGMLSCLHMTQPALDRCGVLGAVAVAPQVLAHLPMYMSWGTRP